MNWINIFNKIIFIFLLAFCISCSKNNLQVPIEIYQEKINANLCDIVFINDSLGFISGGNTYSESLILKTENAGNTWTKIDLAHNDNQKILFAIDAKKNGNIIAAGYGGVIFMSSDFGNSWTQVQEPLWKEWLDVKFINDSTAILCGRENLNKGRITYANLNKQFITQSIDSFPAALQSVQIVENTIYTTAYGAVYTSADKKNWDALYAQGDYFSDAFWYNKNKGIVIGWQGSILKTNNAGRQWQHVRLANTLFQKRMRMHAITKTNKNFLVIAGDSGLILVSKDEGASWQKMETNTTCNLQGICALNENTIIAVGDQGCIVKINL